MSYSLNISEGVLNEIIQGLGFRDEGLNSVKGII